MTPAWLRMSDEEFGDQFTPTRSAGYLHKVLIRALRDQVDGVPEPDLLSRKPLVLRLKPPLPPKLRFYIFNATQHPSERQVGTFKIQLTAGLARADLPEGRRHFDRADGIRPVLLGFLAEWRLFVIWDADLHDRGGGFPYSKNVQAPPEVIWDALARGTAQAVRSLKRPTMQETIVAARSRHLAPALQTRIQMSNRALSDGALF
jgi:hypothetical protein